MSFVFVKKKKTVCEERARKDASVEFNEKISEKENEYELTRNIKIMQEILRLRRLKVMFQKDRFEFHMNNYELGQDSLSDKHSDKEKKSFGLREYVSDLIKNLKGI